MTTATKIRGMAMTARNVPKVMSGAKTQTRRIESWLRSIDDIYDIKNIEFIGEVVLPFVGEGI